MPKSNTNSITYLNALKDRILVFDGAMGTSLQKMDLTAVHFGGEHTNGCNDYLVISYPQAVEAVHRSFLEVGVNVIETDTFRANRITLAEYGLQEHVFEINLAAARLARRLADEYSQPSAPRFVAGSIGPTGKLPSMSEGELSNISFEQLVDVFQEQASGLIAGGVDLILIETSQDLLEVKAAITGIHAAMAAASVKMPIQAQVTLDTTGRMLLGTDISAVLAVLEGMGIAVIGLNCSTGPEHMREPIRYLGEMSTLPVSCIPNAGLPLNVDGQAVYPLEPEPFSDALAEFVEKFHINVVGGCCGTTPSHLKLLVEKCRLLEAKPRPTTAPARLASALQVQPMAQQPPPFLIGERLNTQGSARFKQLMLAQDFAGALTIARQQVESGAHGLDLCVALTERQDESETMRLLVKTLSPVMSVPLVIDTTEPDVLEAALQSTPGRCLINSTNLESGTEKAERIFMLARKYNAAVIALTIDEQGMAKTAQRKLEVATRIYQLAVDRFGLLPGDLVFDPLTFTLATGDPEFSQSALQTLEGIRLIKRALPGVLTSLGVSNVSFGLSPAARAVLNSVMLYHAVQAGLDMAIVNPAHIRPYAEISEEERNLAEDLIFDQRPDALSRLIRHYEGLKTEGKSKTNSASEALASLSAEQRTHYRILHRIKENLEADIDEILQRQLRSAWPVEAVRILNEVLLPAMKEVGDKFGTGELILPFVLQSAEVMKAAVTHLEQFLERKEGVSKGTLVLATVYGDVHDIGKNLVKTILSNNGFAVVDLGKQVPAETIISRAVEAKADAIGLSALLVSTSRQMPLIVNELHRRGLSIPVLIGGAAINRRFGRRILLTDTDQFYEAGVFYCKDAFEGLETMEKLVDAQQKLPLLKRLRQDAEMELGRALTTSPTSQNQPSRSSIPPAEFIPKPPSWGPRVVRSMPLQMVAEHLAKNELFRLSWGAKNTHGQAWIDLQAEYENRLEIMLRQAAQQGWLQPRGVYGYWPAQAESNDLVIYEPGSVQAGSPTELTRFAFPRQDAGDYLCLADYFSPADSGRMDMVALQVVTVGETATQRFDQLQNGSQFSDAYFTHGLAVQMAEAAAEYLHRHIRKELGLPPDQGKRYSWGYPSVPDLSDHRRVFQLLPAESELGMHLTDAFQLVPEQSTAALIVHHPSARYFNVGESRIDQLLGGKNE